MGRTSHFRLGESVVWLTGATSGAAASLELSTSTGVVALLDTEGGMDERSNWSDKDDNEDNDEGSFEGVSYCIGFDSVAGGDGGGGGD